MHPRCTLFDAALSTPCSLEVVTDEILAKGEFQMTAKERAAQIEIKKAEVLPRAQTKRLARTTRIIIELQPLSGVLCRTDHQLHLSPLRGTQNPSSDSFNTRSEWH